MASPAIVRIRGSTILHAIDGKLLDNGAKREPERQESQGRRAPVFLGHTHDRVCGSGDMMLITNLK